MNRQFHVKHHPLVDEYISLLKAENEVMNLYSEKAYERLPFHIQDSVNMALHINGAKKVFDLGSGSGMPSIILAIYNPKTLVYAVESKQKKAKFLSKAKEKLKLNNYIAVNKDANEFIRETHEKPEFITAKAFAPLEKILTILKPYKHNAKLFVPVSLEQKTQLLHNYPRLDFLSTYEKDGFYYLHIPSQLKLK